MTGEGSTAGSVARAPGEARARVSPWGALLKALRYNTTLPIRKRYGAAREWGLAAALFPVVGAALGAIDAAIYLTGSYLWPGRVALLVAWALSFFAGRVYKIDGLADVIDAFVVRRPREISLRIMKDPTTGAVGVLGVVIALVANVVLLFSVPPDRLVATLVAVPMLSRWSINVLAYRSRSAYADSTARDYVEGGAPWLFWTTSALVALAAMALLGPIRAAASLAVAGAGALWLRRLAHARIGGVQGDLFGAASELAVVTVLLVAAAQPG